VNAEGTPSPGERASGPGLSHIDSTGRARMVDVSGKPWSKRRAVARGVVTGDIATLFASLGADRNDGRQSPAGVDEILSAARATGIEAAHRTAQLIPLCHPLPVSALDVRFDVRPSGITIEATAEVVAPTGVEMEALTACLFSALALVSVLGATAPVAIEDVVLWEKSGGRSGHWLREQALAVR
jgi:cyclic pyranopterin monophosphate synthase